MTQIQLDWLNNRFNEYHEDRPSFEEELIRWFYLKYHLTLDKGELEYFLSTVKSWHRKSFVNGFLESLNHQDNE